MDLWRGSSVPRVPGRGGEPYLWDTATGQLVQAAAGRVATMYACGITPYDATHIGHAATFIAWDLLVRAWLDCGHEVVYVQNVTDVDDPLLERAERDGDHWRDLADREVARYRADMAALRVLPPNRLVGAVEAVPVILRFVRRLADRGALYELEGDLYFSRGADPAFGGMSRLDPASMIDLFAERGGDPGRPGKKDPLDPLVWLSAREGEPRWDSRFGPGRPGWHVECAAIATEYLGSAFDVQAGGSDLVFPHHEMSASHARVALADTPGLVPGARETGPGEGADVRYGTGPGGDAGPGRPTLLSSDAGPEGAGEGRPGRFFPFARCYAHAGMVRLDGEKMSKSRGNLVFVSELLAAGTDPMAVRLAILAHHYRRDWDWTVAGLAGAADRLARWRAAVSRGLAALPEDRRGVDTAAAGPAGPAGSAGWAGSAGQEGPPAAAELAMPASVAAAPAAGVLAAVRRSLADDLDTPEALAAVDGWAAEMTAGPMPPPGAHAAALLVRDTVDALLGVAL